MPSELAMRAAKNVSGAFPDHPNGFDVKPALAIAAAIIDEAIAPLLAENERLLTDNERLKRLVREGFDSQRVLEWMREAPRKRANTAFTAGGERAAAYLVEMAERSLESENAALRQQVETLKHLLRQASGWIDDPDEAEESEEIMSSIAAALAATAPGAST